MDHRGMVIEGTIEAGNRRDAIRDLRDMGLYPRIIQGGISLPNGLLSFLVSPLSPKSLSIFCRQFSLLLKSGITLSQSLYILADESQNSSLKRRLKDVYNHVQRGESLSVAMGRQGSRFPPLLLGAIESGEASGTLDTSLEKMANYYEKQYEIRQKVHKSLIYPIVLAITSLIILIFMATVVMPQFALFFENAGIELPGPTLTIIGFSDFMARNRVKLPIYFGILIALLKAFKTSEKGKGIMDRFVLKLPFYGGMMNKIITARFNSTAALLVSTGVSIDKILAISAEATNNTYIGAKIVEAGNEIQKGKGFAEALRITGIFPPEIMAIIAVGEETGRVEEMMEKVADISVTEAENAIEISVSLIEPLLILILGSIIAFIILSVALPMLDMYSHMG